MKKAFTFTELMIVMSIIGVISAFMIPAVTRMEPDETTMKYRQTFFAMEEAVRNLVNDVTLHPDGLLTRVVSATAADNTLTIVDPLDLSSTVSVHNDSDVQQTSIYRLDTDGNGTADGPQQTVTAAASTTPGREMCRNLANIMNTMGEIKCPNDSGLTNLILDNDSPDTYLNMTAANVNFHLTNGAAIGGIYGKWRTTNDDTSTTSTTPFITLCVDVNGFGEKGGPNVGCAPASRAEKKRDQFRIRITQDGKIYTGSPTGPNNWYMENLMLINPRSIEKKKLTAVEKVELTKAIGTRDNADNPANWTTESTCKKDLGFTWFSSISKCIYTAGFVKSR